MLRALLNRPISVLIAALALVTMGGASLLRLPVSLLPSLERPKLVVVASDRQRSRESMLQEVVEPLERALLSIPGVLEVTSRIDDGAARLELVTEWQTDPDRLRIDAERRRTAISGTPLDDLSITVEAGDRAPIVALVVRGGRSAHQRTVWAEQVLRPELSRLRGAGRVERVGGALERVVVRPLAAALAARGLGVDHIERRLARVGQTRPLGRIRDGGTIRPVVLHERVTSLEQLAGLWLAEPDASPTRLGDVATLTREEVPDCGLYRLDGEDALRLELYRAPEANAVALSREARETLEQLAARAPTGVEVELLDDASQEVLGAVGQLGLAALLGLVLGTAVLRLMLGHWRPTLVMSVVVPASLVSALGAFLLWDVSLDVVSLAGLALALGMLVDNAIVVLESIEREPGRVQGNERYVRGTQTIAVPLLAGFLTTAAVFVPLIYLHGLARAFFGVQAFAIVTTLALSLLFSLTLAPVLARLMRAGNAADAIGRQPGRALYLRLLETLLGHPRVSAVVLLVGSVLLGGSLLGILKRELVPPGESRVLQIPFQLSLGLGDERLRTEVLEVERGLQRALRSQGLAPSRIELRYLEWDLEAPSRDDTALDGLATVHLDTAQRADTSSGADGDSLAISSRAIEGLQRGLSESLPGVQLRVERQHAAFARALERARGRWQVEVAAPDAVRVAGLAQRAGDTLAPYGITLDDPTTTRRRSVVDVEWDEHRLADLGLSEASASAQVRSALGGQYRGQVEVESVEPEVLLEQTLPGDLDLLPIVPTQPVRSARALPLGALAQTSQRSREGHWLRRDGRPALVLDVVATDVDPSEGLRPERLRQWLEEVPQGADERLELTGDAAELERAFAQLRLALVLALVLVFLTLAALYESVAMPIVVMATVPVSVCGALLLLWVGGQSLNVMSFLGLILLVGIVVNNSIVLLHRVEQHRSAGQPIPEALRLAAAERYRPILMTTLTTILGMAPLALLGGEGAELRRALAVATCGGLAFGLIASLLLMPSLYRLLAPRRPRAGTRATDDEAHAE